MKHPNHAITAIAALVKRVLDRMPEGGSGGSVAFTQLHAQGQRLHDGASALHGVYSHRNPTETDGAHIKRTATAAQAFAKDVEATRERGRKFYADGMANIEKQIATKTKLIPDAYAAEIRAVFRSLPHSERLKFLTELHDQGRGPEFAAIIKAPRSLTGITEEMRYKFESAFISKHAAAELIDRDGLTVALQTVEVAAQTAAAFAQAYNDPAKLAEITKAEEAAAAAAKAFESSVSQ